MKSIEWAKETPVSLAFFTSKIKRLALRLHPDS
jgi:hypothetical protein